MTARTWTGAVDGSFTTIGNWSPSTGCIDDGDELHFTDASSVDVDSDLSNGSLHVTLFVHEGWTGDIASSGSKLVLGAVSDGSFAARGGRLFLDATITQFTAEAPAARSGALEIDGTITTLYVVGCGGSITVTGGAAMTNLYVLDSPNCVVTIGASVTGQAFHLVESGTVINNSAVATGAGNVRLTGNCLYDHRTGAVTLAELENPGCRYLDKSSGTLSTLRAIAGLFDGRENDNLTKTISAATIAPNSKVLLNNALKSYVVTAYTNLGGIFIPSVGSSQALS